MKEGNVQAAMFAVYPTHKTNLILKGLDLWFRLVNNPANGLMQIKTVEDFSRVKGQGKKGAILHFEGAGGIDLKHRLLRIGYHLGLRTMSLTWSNVNNYATGALFTNSQKKTGLTDKGRALIEEAQALGITIDVSHLNDLSFWDVYEVTKKPIIASHSNSRAIANVPRNLTDDQIKAIKEKRGTIGINFSTQFLIGKNPREVNKNLGFEVIKKHIDYIENLTDINTIAVGSDFDGTVVPEFIKDCTCYPKLWKFLIENGYSESDIKKVSHENLIRVFYKTWN
jgi:membrane dipeptidase